MQPAILLGFDSQGRGEYRNIINVQTEKQFSRYEQKSFGYYIVASKNYDLMGGNIGIHFGINKSLETEDGDDDFNIFFGIDKEINRSISFMLEYDAMLNDNNNEYDYQDITLENIALGNGIGYFNAGFRWFIADNILIELNFNDINNEKYFNAYFSKYNIHYVI